jgi:hypothetical protein
VQNWSTTAPSKDFGEFTFLCSGVFACSEQAQNLQSRVPPYAWGTDFWRLPPHKSKVQYVKRVIVAAVLLLLACSLPQELISSAGQVPDHSQELLEQVAHSMGRYARDLSELPLNVVSTISRFDSNGTEKHQHSSSHSMQFVKRSYADGKVIRRLEAHKRGLHRVSSDEVNGDSATGLLALLFDNGKISGAYRYDLIEHLKSNRLEVKIADVGPCQGFDPTVVRERQWCGVMDLLLDGTTLEPIRASFKAAGFPKIFNGIRYLSFDFVEEFQTIPMKGNSAPFLLPLKTVVHYDTERERTTVESTFSAVLNDWKK